MGHPSVRHYPQTTGALRRLEQAVARLETASGAAVRERQALTEELDVLRRDCAAMEGVNREVTERLDAAIGRLQRLLGG